jgi:hypothetical protein
MRAARQTLPGDAGRNAPVALSGSPSRRGLRPRPSIESVRSRTVYEDTPSKEPAAQLRSIERKSRSAMTSMS